MIRLDEVTKTFRADGVVKTIADRVSLTFGDTGAVALVGRNGAGKSSLLKLIAGTMRPTSGRIVTDGLVSWPIGFAGSFHADLSGMQNTRFVARVYGVDTDQLEAFVHDMAELGDYFYLPFRTYSSGMRARLAFAVSMGIDFDTYLIDEVTSVGDAAFREKSEAVLEERIADRAAIVVSHNLPLLARMCSAAVLIEGGKATWFDDVDACIDAHRKMLAPA